MTAVKFFSPSQNPDLLLQLLEAIPLPAAALDLATQAHFFNVRMSTMLEAVKHQTSLESLFNDERISSININGIRYQCGRSSFTPDSKSQYSLLFLTPGQTESKAVKSQMDAHERLFNAIRTQSAGEMTTILSHELNQPLGAIINYLNIGESLLSDAENVAPRALKAIALAKQQAQQATAVIARLREFVSARQLRLEHQNMADLIQGCINLSLWELQAQNIDVQITIDSPLPDIPVDSTLIGQVITNLIQNAVHAMSEIEATRRLLEITACVDLDNRIKISVRDTGCGMTPEAQLELFTPFYTTKTNGMGIGLAICRSIMELHAGNLYLEHSNTNGSLFCITFPPCQELN